MGGGGELELLQRLAAASSNAASFTDLLDNIRSILEERHPLERVVIAAPDATRQHLSYVAVASGSVGVGAGSNLEWVAQQRIPLVQPDTAEPIVPFDTVQRENGVASYVMVPIVARGIVIGTLGVGSSSPHSPWCADVPFLMLVAGQLAGAIAAHMRAQHAEQAAAEKDELLSVVAHELRSPITAITGFAALLADARADAHREEMLATIGRAGRRLSLMVDDLLDAGRADRDRLELRIEEVDLADLVRMAAEEFLEKPVEVQAPGELTVRADPDRLLQVTVNLFSNAMRYGAPPIRAELATAPTGPVLRVVDHGGGFRAEIADRLFTKYATTGGDGRGTGIGLWLVRRIIEAHGGRVSAGNRPGAGAEVVVRLPKVPVP